MGTSDAVLPWALKILMIALVTVAVFIYRKPFVHLFSAVGYGMVGSRDRAEAGLAQAGSLARRNTRGRRHRGSPRLCRVPGGPVGQAEPGPGGRAWPRSPRPAGPVPRRRGRRRPPRPRWAARTAGRNRPVRQATSPPTRPRADLAAAGRPRAAGAGPPRPPRPTEARAQHHRWTCRTGTAPASSAHHRAGPAPEQPTPPQAGLRLTRGRPPAPRGPGLQEAVLPDQCYGAPRFGDPGALGCPGRPRASAPARPGAARQRWPGVAPRPPAAAPPPSGGSAGPATGAAPPTFGAAPSAQWCPVPAGSRPARGAPSRGWRPGEQRAAQQQPGRFRLLGQPVAQPGSGSASPSRGPSRNAAPPLRSRDTGSGGGSGNGSAGAAESVRRRGPGGASEASPASRRGDRSARSLLAAPGAPEEVAERHGPEPGPAGAGLRRHCRGARRAWGHTCSSRVCAQRWGRARPAEATPSTTRPAPGRLRLPRALHRPPPRPRPRPGRVSPRHLPVAPVQPGRPGQGGQRHRGVRGGLRHVLLPGEHGRYLASLRSLATSRAQRHPRARLRHAGRGQPAHPAEAGLVRRGR